jgi:Patatin-like phospholipase
MNAIKNYFKRVNKKIDQPESKKRTELDTYENGDANYDDELFYDDLAIDTYKIITVTTDSARSFLIYGNEDESETPLNSGALIKLLDFKSADQSFLEKLFDLKGAEIGIDDPSFTLADKNRHSSMCKWFAELEECSSVLKETQIFYNFDPYCNFLLGKNATHRDVRDIIKKTTSGTALNNNECMNFDFTKMVNPYGLEEAVFTGGGTKGNIYIGTTIGLLATGQIFYLNRFTGTSIGGLSAMVTSCITPTRSEYYTLKEMTLREIMTRGCWLVRRYQRAIEFATARFCERDMDTFYEKPSLSIYGIWTMASKIMKDNGLYNPETSGFQVWYALICLRLCQIMMNGLDKKIIIKDENGKIIRFIEEYSSNDHRYTDAGKKRRKSTKLPMTNEKKTDVIIVNDQSVDEVIDPENDVEDVEEVEEVEDGVFVTEQDSMADDNNDEIKDETVETDNQTGLFGSAIFSSLSSDDSGNYRDIRESDVDTLSFVGWTIESFYTFTEYYEETGKSIVLTGTKTDRIETVYYSHTDPNYSNLTVIQGARATMSIPWIFEAPIINGSYHLDGGVYDNYPLTHADIKTKERIKHYNNRVFGYLIDDQNSIIDAYEVMRELWLVYTGFLQIMNVGYLSSADNFDEISRLFFEIRQEVYKMIYFADTEISTFLSPQELDKSIESYNITGLTNVLQILREHMDESSHLNFQLVHKGPEYVVQCLQELRGTGHTISRRDSSSSTEDFERKFKIGRTTDLADIMDLAIKHGTIYNELTAIIKSDLREIERLESEYGDKMKIVKRYERILNHLMRDILSYYEVKGTFIRTNDLDQPCRYFVKLLKNLNAKLVQFDELTKNATEVVRKADSKTDKFKNYMQPSIDIGLMMISKIVTRGTGNDYDIQDIQTSQAVRSSYQKVVDYFFHTDMTGILYKYMCIANDRICNDMFNQMRTIKLNTFETNTMHFSMERDLKSRLIYEGYSKTIKHFANLLRIMEMTKRGRAPDEYIPSYELRYKGLYR